VSEQEQAAARPRQKVDVVHGPVGVSIGLWLNIGIMTVTLIGIAIQLGRKDAQLNSVAASVSTLSSAIAEQSKLINSLALEDVASRKDREHITQRLAALERQFERLGNRNGNPNS
jgi:outer membrane murein-binding lipoprotein Lpp